MQTMSVAPLIGYYHDHFVQNRRDLCWKVLRVQKKERQLKRIPETREPEPNFYSAEYAIGANDDLKMPPTETANLMPSNFYSSQPMSMGLSTTQSSFYPSFFATAPSTANPNSSLGLLQQQQQLTMNHPTLFTTSPSEAHDHLLYQQQVVVNNLVASSSGQQGINVSTALANLDMDAWASALQGLGGTSLQQSQSQELSTISTTMFPSATVSQQQSSMLPPQSILQQLSTMARYESKPTTFPCNVGPATAPVPGRFHSNRRTDDTEVRMLSNASISEVLSSGLSSRFLLPHGEPSTANQSFDAYLAALQFENGDITNSTEEDEAPAIRSREPSPEVQQKNE